MDAIFLKVFSEQWIIYWIFVTTFLSFIWKGIPYAVKKFDTVIQTFNETQKIQQASFDEIQKAQQASFERSLSQLITSFVAEWKSNSEWHREHWQKLDAIQKQLQDNTKVLEENNKKLEGCKFVQSAKFKYQESKK